MNTKLKFKKEEVSVNYEDGTIAVKVKVTYPDWIINYAVLYGVDYCRQTFFGISRLKKNDKFDYKKGVHIAETKAITAAKRYYFNFLNYAVKRMHREAENMKKRASKEASSIHYNEEYLKSQ